MLHFDQRESASKAVVSVTDQLRKDHNAEGLYDFLFGLQYLKPQYSLTYDGQEISQLSPGERGLLLLVFYLLVDKDDIPLVIDQPEENLDNQTIFFGAGEMYQDSQTASASDYGHAQSQSCCSVRCRADNLCGLRQNE